MYVTPVVDAHLHVTESGEWTPPQYNASVATLMEQMELGGISKGIILGLTHLRQNRYLETVCANSNGRLFALAAFNPIADRLDELEGLIANPVFRGVKLHPRRDNFAPLDKRAFPLYEIAQEKGWPINFDVFGHSTLLPMGELRPTAFDRVAKKFPGLKMVLSHCCAPWVMEAFFAAKSNPNLYLDCSFIISRYRGSSVVMDLQFTAANLDQKLIYGSDFPEEQAHRYLSLAKIEFKDLPEEKKNNIFGLNAIKVYGI